MLAGPPPPASFARSDAWISGGWRRRRGGRKNLHAEMGGDRKRPLLRFSLAFLAFWRINGGPHIPGMGIKSLDYRITAFELASNPDHVPRRHECCTTASRTGKAFVLLHARLCVYYARQEKEKNSFGKKCSSPPHPPPHPYPNM